MPQVTATAHVFPSANDLVGTNPVGEGRTNLEKNLSDRWLDSIFQNNFVISGGALPASDPDLTLTVPTGKAWIAGRFVDWQATNVTLPASATSWLWIRILRDASTNVSSVVIEHNTTGLDPAPDDSVLLGSAVTGASAVTGTVDRRAAPRLSSLDVGPFGGHGTGSAFIQPGLLSVRGGINGFEFVRRSLATFPDAPAAGDSWIWYNPDGTARLWTPGTGDLVEFFPTTNQGVRFPRGFAVDAAGGVVADSPAYPARIKQQVNGQYGLELIRQTDTNPAGAVLRVINAAYTAALMSIDALGQISAPLFQVDANNRLDGGGITASTGIVGGVGLSGGLIISNSVSTAALRTAIGFALASGVVDATMNDFCFAWTPWVVGSFGSIKSFQQFETGDTVPRIRLVDDFGGHIVGIRWRYMTASDEPTIYVVVDPSTGAVVGAWVSDDPVRVTEDVFEDDPDNPGGQRLVRNTHVLSTPPIGSPSGIAKAVPLSTLAQIMISQRILDSADRHIEREKLNPENRLYRALQFHARDLAPAKWLMENCAWDVQGDVIRELKENEKAAKRAR